ncbi:39S ribosomal protein L37, mitochondrial-like [Actinia tenebrosa]|uniref:Large ribosomal subunit protein mL37 n=1 Tax=Actinia tenebrosa TaxID=6105 RepID=A0A6P8IIN6_ACTTE|nr:39S ribosomal protein L37, mitochondrial-like [Actinia tenebrosa]
MAATNMWNKCLSNFKNHSFITTNQKLLSFRYILGRHAGLCTAVKPYAFHPKTRTLESDIQALYLTKTIQKEGLPDSLQKSILDDTLTDKMMDRFRQCVVQTRLFNYEGERSTKTTCALPLMLNMMKVVWSEANSFPGLNDMSLSHKPHVSAVWKRHDDAIQVSGNLGYLLSSKTLLSPYVPADSLKETEEIKLESLDLIAPVFNLLRVASNCETDTGFYDGTPYPHAHTLVLVNTENKWSTRERCAQGLMFTFGRLVNQATNLHGNQMGKILKEPLTAQCVVSDGYKLSFIIYQLNTLDFSSDEGVKNIAWVLPGMKMYEKALLEEVIPESGQYETKVEGFNRDCFEIFTNLITNGTLR